METERTCSFQARTYSHGAEICHDDKCMRCVDGQWEDMENYEPGSSEQNREGLVIAPGKDLSDM